MKELLITSFIEYTNDLKRIFKNIPRNTIKSAVSLAQGDMLDKSLLYLLILGGVPFGLLCVLMMIALLCDAPFQMAALVCALLLPGYIIKVLSKLSVEEDTEENYEDLY